MKRCPKCAADYYDEMLEFCLEDGAKLFVVSKPTKNAPFTGQHTPSPLTEKTFNLPFADGDETVESIKPSLAQTIQQADYSLEKTLDKSPASLKALEVLPVIFALSHNWWQWLYAANQTTSSVSAFLISANFLVWILLLAAGAGISILAMKRCQNNGFAFVSLVMLSVNLILFLVPKR